MPRWFHSDQANRDQSSALNCRVRHHIGWRSPRRTTEQRLKHRTHLSCPPPLWVPVPTPTKRTEDKSAPSSVVPATTLPRWFQSDQANRGQSSDLNCRGRHYSGWLGPRRPREQRPHKRHRMSWRPGQWLARPTPTKATDDRAAPSPIMPATTVASWAHAVRGNRRHSSAPTSRARHDCGWLCKCRPREQRPEQRPHVSWGPTQ